jgi:hypothetical protein
MFLHKKRSVAAVLWMTLVALLPIHAFAQAKCPLGYTVAFFNGVGNTYGDAVASMHATQAAIRESQNTTYDAYDSEDVAYEVMYNTTAAQAANAFDPVNTTILQDIAEVFVQRAKELDPSGTVGNNFFYIFWEWMDGPPQNYSNRIGNSTASNNFFVNFVNAAVTAAAASLGRLVGSQAPTAADYAQQEAQLTADAAAGRKVLMVAHSQGNLFVTHGYDFVLPLVSAARAKVVHLAPASVTVRGDYELSGNDLIINGLRLVNGIASVVDSNILPPVSSVDPTGHGYSEVYLSADLIDANSGRPDRAIIKDKFSAALQALDAQQCALTVTPSNPVVTAGTPYTLSATLTPPVNDANQLAITYQWKVSGAAGGTFTDPLLGTQVSTVTTTHPNVVYNALSSATEGQTDSITVEMDVSTANNNNATTKKVADNTASPAVITVGGSVVFSPRNPTVSQSASQVFTVSPDGWSPPAGVTYQWTLSGVGSIGTNNAVSTPSGSITYTAPGSAGAATLSVSIVTAEGATIGAGSTSITVSTAVDVSAWVGDFVCPSTGSGVTTMHFYASPYTNPYIDETRMKTVGLVPAQNDNLLTLGTNTNLGAAIFNSYFMQATSATSANVHNGYGYVGTLTLSGGVLTGDTRLSAFTGCAK